MQPAGGGIRCFGFTLAGEAAANVRRDCQYCTNMYSYNTAYTRSIESHAQASFKEFVDVFHPCWPSISGRVERTSKSWQSSLDKRENPPLQPGLCVTFYRVSVTGTVRPENPPSYGSCDMPDLKSEEDECI